MELRSMRRFMWQHVHEPVPESIKGPRVVPNLQSRTPKSFSAELFTSTDLQWKMCEDALDRAEKPLALQSRLAWVNLIAGAQAQLIAVCDENDEPVLAVSILSTPTRALPRHEIWRIERLGLDQPLDAVAYALEVAKTEAHARRRVLQIEAIIVAVDRERRQQISAAAAKLGFRRRDPPLRTYEHTLILDLTSGNADKLLADLPKRTRQKIRLPARRGLEIRVVDDPALAPRMNALMRETMARTGSTPERTDWPLVIEMCQMHPERSRLVGMFVEGSTRPDDLLAFSWGCHHGEYGHYNIGASTRSFDTNISLGYSLVWDLVLWAQANGARWFDFGGITEGVTNSADPLGGISDMKRHFSRSEVSVGEEWVYVLCPMRARIAAAVSRLAQRIRA
jgi:hypothetical protein